MGGNAEGAPLSRTDSMLSSVTGKPSSMNSRGRAAGSL